MKKYLSVILVFVVVTLYTFSACQQKLKNSLDIYDDINVYTTLEELKALHNGTIISENGEHFAIKDCTNTVIQDIVKKYNSDCRVNISKSSVIDPEDTLYISTFVPGKIQISDYDDLISKLSQKYPSYTIDKGKEWTKIYLDYDEECRFAFITVLFIENNSILIEYKFHPKDFYKD